jgi:hypothetical protein
VMTWSLPDRSERSYVHINRRSEVDGMWPELFSYEQIVIYKLNYLPNYLQYPLSLPRTP